MLTRELLRARLGNAINEQILEKALVLELRHFEDADVYDKMQNARREASARPLNLVLQSFTIVQHAGDPGQLRGPADRPLALERGHPGPRLGARLHLRGATGR